MYEEVYLNSTSFIKSKSGDDQKSSTTATTATDDELSQAKTLESGESRPIDLSELTSSTEQDSIVHISHNSILNCLFILTKSNKLVLYDCNSRMVLRTIDWSKEAQHLQDKYLNPGRLKDTSKPPNSIPRLTN